jgi:uncharacterized damage-inducible protein DinB
MERTKWFERRFALIEDNGLFPGLLERLEGTPARLYYKLKKIQDSNHQLTTNTPWSIKKEIGHLTDLEPLWLNRVEQLVASQPELSAADLTNQKTNEAAHDEKTFPELLDEFYQARMKLVTRLRTVTDGDLGKRSLHPRLQIQMRLIDLAYFIAEHDDHHLAQVTSLLKEDKSWMDQNVV